MLVGLALAAVGYGVYLDYTIRTQFEGKRWALPARVYARPIEIYPGAKWSAAQITEELATLGYRYAENGGPGTWRRAYDALEIVSRPFTFWDGAQPSIAFHVGFSGNRVDELRRTTDGERLTLVRLDPLPIGGIYPAHNEDRVLVKLDQVPPDLVKALIAIEDRKFRAHHGVDPLAVARALLVNLRAAETVQGGSTLTQQLVKNFYLTAERSLRRKLVEMVMAVLLDAHYTKDEILEAYVNEIYLGQDGNRAIHGFGLAAQYYFDRPLEQLSLPQIALLVGLVKGPSYYDPRRHPERATARRNLVLAELERQGAIPAGVHLKAKLAPLEVTARAPMGTSPHPAFLNLVHRQLRGDYPDEVLRSDGLLIFTTLDPRVQRAAETTLRSRLASLERQRRLPANSLQGAITVTNTDNGEVLAVVGGRDPRLDGFNRALDAERPVGSLIKPLVYLTALQHPERYTLATPLDDSALVWQDRGAPQEWAPQNYDKQFHGMVPLHTALAQSYNVSTARLGLALGLTNVTSNAERLGITRPLPAYGSTLIGATSLTVLEVAQMYQTLAGGGFRTPLRAIREVLTPAGEPLSRYPYSVEQTIDAAPVFLLTSTLQEAVRTGTGTGLAQYLPAEINVAGKTGTTDDLRDSWFAGFTGDKLGVVWIGHDDNSPIGLTGAVGSLTVWGEMMQHLDPEPLVLTPPDTIEYAWIDRATGLRADANCADAQELPFIRGSAPVDTAPCSAQAPLRTLKHWLQRWFGW